MRRVAVILCSGVASGAAAGFAQYAYWHQPMMLYSDPTSAVRQGGGGLVACLLVLLCLPSVLFALGTSPVQIKSRVLPIAYLLAAWSMAVLVLRVRVLHVSEAMQASGSQVLVSPSVAATFSAALFGLIAWLTRAGVLSTSSRVGWRLDAGVVALSVSAFTFAVIALTLGLAVGPE